MAKGKKKSLSEAEIKRRAERLAMARKKRWPKRDAKKGENK